jgi:hypothetical protein
MANSFLVKDQNLPQKVFFGGKTKKYLSQESAGQPNPIGDIAR